MLGCPIAIKIYERIDLGDCGVAGFGGGLGTGELRLGGFALRIEHRTRAIDMVLNHRRALNLLRGDAGAVGQFELAPSG